MKTVDVGKPADNLGVLLKSVKRDKLRRGMVLSAAHTLTFANSFRAKLYLLTEQEAAIARPLMHDSLLMFYHDTFNCISVPRLESGDNTFVMQGDSCDIQMVLQKKTPLTVGSRFTIRFGSKTLGYGIISKFLPDEDWIAMERERRKRRKLEAKEQAIKEAMGIVE